MARFMKRMTYVFVMTMIFSALLLAGFAIWTMTSQLQKMQSQLGEIQSALLELRGANAGIDARLEGFERYVRAQDAAQNQFEWRIYQTSRAANNVRCAAGMRAATLPWLVAPNGAAGAQ